MSAVSQLPPIGKRKEAPPTDSAPSSKRRKLARLSSGYISLESSPASSSDTGTPAHHPTAPSPSSTLHSSQVLADANLTAEFQHICQVRDNSVRDNGVRGDGVRVGVRADGGSEG